jgi:hypothetical protein
MTMLPVVLKPQPIERPTRSKPIASIEIELRRGVLRVHNGDAALIEALIAALSA